MKKKIDFMQVLSYVLTVLAVVSGGGCMAVGTLQNPSPDDMVKADPAYDPTAAIPNEPAREEINDRKMPGGDFAGQDLTGTQVYQRLSYIVVKKM